MLPVPTGAKACPPEPGLQHVQVVAFASGLLALGSCGHAVGPSFAWASPDGTSWTGTAPASLATADIYEVISRDGLLVAVGSDVRNGYEAAAWTSHDGKAWTRSTGNLGVGVMDSVATLGSTLVAFGNRAPEVPEWPGTHRVLEWTSTDGVAWSPVPLSASMFPDAGVAGPLVAGPHGLVVAGFVGPVTSSAAVWLSPDARSWTKVSGGRLADIRSMNQLVADGPRLMLLGAGSNGQARIWTSLDGVVWHGAAAPGQEALFGAPSLAGGSGRFAFGGYPLVAVPSPASVWTSVDGVTWRATPDLPSDILALSIAWSGDVLVVAGATHDGRAAIISLQP